MEKQKLWSWSVVTFPDIGVKKIWISSMVLISSDYCLLLMGIAYYWIDYKERERN